MVDWNSEFSEYYKRRFTGAVLACGDRAEGWRLFCMHEGCWNFVRKKHPSKAHRKEHVHMLEDEGAPDATATPVVLVNKVAGGRHELKQEASRSRPLSL